MSVQVKRTHYNEEFGRGEWVYGIGSHGGESEAVWLAKTRAVRRAKLRPRGIVFDETCYKMGSQIAQFFCLLHGHHFRAHLETFVNSNKGCPFCEGTMMLDGSNHVPLIDDDAKWAGEHRKRYGRMYVDIPEVKRRLALFKCKLHDETKYSRSKNPIDLECFVCGNVWRSLAGCDRIFGTYYNRKARGVGFEDAEPACPKCRKERLKYIVLPDGRKVRRMRGAKKMSVEEVNKRCAKWKVRCIRYYVVKSRENVWECECGNTFKGNGASWVYGAGQRKKTPCKPCCAKEAKARRLKWKKNNRLSKKEQMA